MFTPLSPPTKAERTRAFHLKTEWAREEAHGGFDSQGSLKS